MEGAIAQSFGSNLDEGRNVVDDKVIVIVSKDRLMYFLTALDVENCSEAAWPDFLENVETLIAKRNQTADAFYDLMSRNENSQCDVTKRNPPNHSPLKTNRS